MIKKFSEEHKLAYIIILLSLLFFLNSCDAIKVATNKSDYTKVTGEVIGTYTERTGTRRHRSTIKYLKISLVYEGEVYYVEGIKANFWEGVGDKVDFYISSNGTATRGAFTLSFSHFAIFVALLIYGVKELWVRRDTLFTKAHAPVGTIIDDYNFVQPESTKEPTFYSTTMKHTPQAPPSQTVIPSTTVSMDTQNISTGFSTPTSPETQNISASFSTPTSMEPQNIATNSTSTIPTPQESDSREPQPEASFHDISVISIPDEYLH